MKHNSNLNPLTVNERRVLAAVWQRGPIARSEIAEETGLGDASITRLARDLEHRGLVFDSVRREGRRGQPTRPLQLCSDGAYAFGVNFSHSYIDLGLIDLTGKLVSLERRPLERATAGTIADIAREVLTRQVAEIGIGMGKVIGAGFSLPGDFLETPHFLHAHAAFPELRNCDLQSELANAMPVPVSVENDGTSAALGERVHGIGRGYNSLLFIHIGHGVGAGVIIDGHPWRGARGNAGTLGVIYPMSERRPSGQDLFETLREEGVAISDFDALEEVDIATCPPLRRWMVRAGEQLGHGLHLAARILDPDIIVLGGRLPPRINEAFADSINIDAAFGASKVLPYPRLVASRLGPHAGVIGAASVCFYRAFFASVGGQE